MSTCNREHWLDEYEWRPHWPWEVELTICIAAACIEDGDINKRRIVQCTDSLVSNALGSAETMMKQTPIGHNFQMLPSGTAPEASAMRRLLKKHFGSAEGIDETNVLVLVKSAIHERKREIVESFVQNRYALSYDELIRFGKEKIPIEQFNNTFIKISGLTPEIEFLVTGFDQYGQPIIIVAGRGEEPFITEGFGVVGSGLYLASSALLQREVDYIWPLNKTVYAVWEAKKYAERVKTVGKATTLTYRGPGGLAKILHPTGTMAIRDHYNNYGPKDLLEDLELPEDAFDELGSIDKA